MFKKNIRGLITLAIGILFLIGTFFMFKNLDIDDVLIVVLMTFSVMIILYGVFQLVRDSLQ